MTIKYKAYNKHGELMRPVAGKIEWTDKELYEDLPRALKALRDSQGLGTLKSKKIVGVIWEEKKKQWYYLRQLIPDS